MKMATHGEKQLSYGEVWRFLGFRRFLIAQALSMAGDAICLAALPVALLRAEFTTGLFGVVMASVGAGSVIGAWAGGVLADRQPAGKILIITDILRGVLQCVAVMAIFYNAHWSGVAFIYLLFGMAIGVSRPCAQVFLVNLLPKHALIVGNSLLNFVDNAVAVLLPATVGVLIIVQSPLFGVLVDGVSFFAAAYLTALIPLTQVEFSKAKVSLCEGFRGIRIIKEHHRLSMGMVATLVINVLAFPVFLVVVPFAMVERFNEFTWGLCLAASGFGACIGSVAAVLYKGHERAKLLSVLCTFLLGFAFSLFAVADEIWIALMAAMIVGGVEACWLTAWATVIQVSAPEKELGKVVAVDTLLTTAMHPFVYLGCGLLGEAVGYTYGLLFFGSMVVVAGIALAVASILSVLRGVA